MKSGRCFKTSGRCSLFGPIHSLCYDFVVKNLHKTCDLAAIRRRILLVRPESPRRWGKMTSHQMINHQADSLRGMMGLKPVSPAGRPNKILKFLALWLPLPWPKGVATRPEMDQLNGGTPPAEFQADVQAFMELLERFTRTPREFQFQAHPMFGEMQEHEWMRWGYLHIDHHLRQFGV
jgi:hypothetical protein